MELIYLLFSLMFTCLTSFALSLLLLCRSLFIRIRSYQRLSADADSVSIYEGSVWHDRRCHVRHSFRYSVRYALFDLDRCPRPPSNHLSADEARRVAETTGPVLLLTIPPSVGYEQNPLSLYYCYDVEGHSRHLNKCIAEVTNTPWGERVTFVFNPNSDSVAKPLHVSPFMDMKGNWSIRTDDPGESLSVFISVQHPELGDHFVATLKVKRISSCSVSDHALFFWLMPHKVALWIYWQALKLWWKNVQFIQHPRYGNPKYREEALIRDQKLQCCQEPVCDKDKHLRDQAPCPENFADGHYRKRQFKWRDAKWPWC